MEPSLETPPHIPTKARAKTGGFRAAMASRLAGPTRDWSLAPRRSGVAVGILTFVVSCLSLGALYWLGRNALQENVRDELRQLALAASCVVDMTAHEELVNKTQMGSPEHLKALAPLVAFHKYFPEIKYLYTVRVREGKQSFVLDTWFDPAIAARGTGTLSPIGEAYQSDSTDEDRLTLEAISRGETYASDKVFTDAYGAFISGSAPLRDASGKVVGYVGMDLTMDDFYHDMRPIQMALLAGLLVAGTLSLATGAGVSTFLRQRQQTREVASAQQALMARVLESLNDGIIVLRAVRDPQTREAREFKVVQTNSAAERLTGLMATRLLGRPLREAVPGLGGTELDEAFSRVMRTGQVYQGSRAFARAGWNGWLHLTIVRVDERLVLALSDISASKRHEQELEQDRAAAEAAERSTSLFLANLSHEIRTPLNAVMGMSHLLQGTQLSPEQAEYLTAIHESSDALLTVINDVLDYSKIQAGGVTVDKSLFDTRNFLNRLKDQFGGLARCKGLSFALEVAPDVPRQVKTDPARLRQVLMNILANALKFTERGHVTLHAVVESGGRGWRIEVSDTGVGIPLELQGEIFRPFTQGDPTATRRFGGTGLGLAISARLTELLGGRIEVASQPGLGSTFTVCLPL